MLDISKHDEIKKSNRKYQENERMMEFLKMTPTHLPTNKAGSRDAIASKNTLQIHSLDTLYLNY